MSQTTDVPYALRLPRPAEPVLLRLLKVWCRRSTSRSDLSLLDDNALKDIGISRYDAEVECSKPFWQA